MGVYLLTQDLTEIAIRIADYDLTTPVPALCKAISEYQGNHSCRFFTEIEDFTSLISQISHEFLDVSIFCSDGISGPQFRSLQLYKIIPIILSYDEVMTNDEGEYWLKYNNSSWEKDTIHHIYSDNEFQKRIEIKSIFKNLFSSNDIPSNESVKLMLARYGYANIVAIHS